MSVPEPPNCQDTFNHLSSKYWEALNSMGLLGESDVSNASDLVQIMYKHLTYSRILNLYCDNDTECADELYDYMATFFFKSRAQPDDKRRHEYILDFLSNMIRGDLIPNDLGLSNNTKCNFLGNDPNDISDWGKENGPHYDADNVDDFLKHNFPFLKPPQPGVWVGGRRKSRKKRKSRRKPRKSHRRKSSMRKSHRRKSHRRKSRRRKSSMRKSRRRKSSMRKSRRRKSRRRKSGGRKSCII